MAFIIEPYQSDHLLQLGIEDYARSFYIGTNWQKIRVGIRYNFSAVGSSSNSGFFFGICQGTTNTFSSVNTTDFMGINYGSTIGNSLYTYNAAGYLTPSGGNYQTLNRVGNTTSQVTQYSGSPAFSANPVIHSMLFLDILKGSPNYTVSIYYTNTTQVLLDFTRPVFCYSMAVETSVANLTGATGAAVAYSGAGLFDSVNIAWNKAVPPLNIYDIGVCRFT